MEEKYSKYLNSIDEIAGHTEKKFEIIEKYVTEWAYKLLQNQYCTNLIYIDCMSNAGLYKSKSDQHIINGSALRVANKLNEISQKYLNKKVALYFNDYDKKKIEILKDILPNEKNNFKIVYRNSDWKDFLNEIKPIVLNKKQIHYLLLFDPYEASIDWAVLKPFFLNWGEVLVNHMVSDTIRAMKVVKSDKAKEKYQNTYLESVENLESICKDKRVIEKIVENIISELSIDGRISAFPIFNTRNAQQYYLIHWTKSDVGNTLFKKIAWKVFEGKSSNKQVEKFQQFKINIDGGETNDTDFDCLTIIDIAKYIQNNYKGLLNVSLNTIWEDLSKHPIFPSEGFRNEIKNELKEFCGAIIKNNTISFKDEVKA